MNFLYANHTDSDLRIFHAAIKASLEKDGTLPEDLADLFTVALETVTYHRKLNAERRHALAVGHPIEGKS